MCGRYSLSLPLSFIQQMLEDDGVQIENATLNQSSEAHHQTYNFAPGSNGVVCRADVSPSSVELKGKDHHAADDKSPGEGVSSVESRDEVIKYILQSMKWGILPSWSKQNDASIRGVINCRDDSLKTRGGMWQSIKARKRCIVVAQGFFEWLNVSGKEKHPYFIKRRDGHLMCFAGLWDSIQPQEETGNRIYSYAIITTDSNQQLRFLHHRMPVIFDAGSEEFHRWLYPLQQRWTDDLQSLLKPFQGELDIYPVNRSVGKVGRSSPSFIVPLTHNDEEHGIARFFPKASDKPPAEKPESPDETRREIDEEQHLVFPNNKRDSPESTESPRKHGTDSSYTPPSKKRHIKPAPQGVQRITEFFGQKQRDK
ncbi:hypothetical protein ACQKWADRAFT_295148 [Trichoderma austrokoningii]